MAWLDDQRQAFRHFFFTPHLRVPVLIIWVATFGSSLHEPVTAFFYLKLDASASDIGNLRTVATTASLLLAPVYGSLADASPRGTSLAIRASSVCCALGCLIRGIATNVNGLLFASFIMGCGIGLWNLVLTSVAASCPEEKRTVIVSTFLAQEMTLRILGRLSYTPFDYLLVHAGFDDLMLRYRIIMSVCTAFCIVGAIWLLVSSPPKIKMDDTVKVVPIGVVEARNAEEKSRIPFVLLSLGVFCLHASITVTLMLWPLYVSDRFGWSASQFAWVVVSSSSVRAAAMGLAPRLKCIPPAIAAVAAGVLVHFAFGGVGGEDAWKYHVILSLIYIFCAGYLEPFLKTRVSLEFPRCYQGRIWASLFFIQSLAVIFGSIVGTRLYSHENPHYVGGPFALCNVALLACAACIEGANRFK